MSIPMIVGAKLIISAMNLDSAARFFAGRRPNSPESASAARLDAYRALQLIMEKYAKNVSIGWLPPLAIGRISLIDFTDDWR